MSKIWIIGIALLAGLVLFGGIVLAQSSQTNPENRSSENHFNHMREMLELHESANKENWTQPKFFDAMSKEMQEHMKLNGTVMMGSDMPCHKNGGMMENSNAMHGTMGGNFNSDSHQRMHQQMHGTNNPAMGRMH